jgi:alpha-L-fucosidase 2
MKGACCTPKKKVNLMGISTISKRFLVASVLIFFVGCLLMAQTTSRAGVVSSGNLVWSQVNSDFFNGAFIGDGVHGAMITQDNQNANNMRFTLGHYKAVAHRYIAGVDMVDSRVYLGSVVLSPTGSASKQSMHLDIWNGQATGTMVTDKGSINWRAVSDRKHSVVMLVVDAVGGESANSINFREEWGISTAFYQGGKNPDAYGAVLPDKPVLAKDGDIELVVSKMKSRGAHVVASQLVNVSGNVAHYFIAIGTDDNNNLDVAAKNATADAVLRLKSAMADGEPIVTARNRKWWNDYMLSSYLQINEDPYWQKFWWLQIYKFACASSENAGLLIDTQGPWTTPCGWSGVWWNLNVQLSYFPLFSANKLAVGRSLIDGMDRIYKSGMFNANAGGAGKGITVGRSSAYGGKSSWGDEFGNLPWALQCYYKYWKYLGDDALALSLFPMLKESYHFLKSKMVLEADGMLHMVPSRSPEYTEELYKDANYAIMSAAWVIGALLEIDSLFTINDPDKSQWLDTKSKLIPFPTDVNGLRVSADQGFDKGHRHYSHLLAIYPYHTLSPDITADRLLIQTSINRWQSLSQISGAAGYTYTGGCAMYATLGDGAAAIGTLDRLKPMLQPNTMYKEGNNPVLETPLSGVESINYMLLQSWDGVIRVFPAVPERWKNLSFEKFRAEGAFLVSAQMADGAYDRFTVFSEKGKPCTVKNPWPDKVLVVSDAGGKKVPTVVNGSNHTFLTNAGTTYRVTHAKAPALKRKQAKQKNK